MSFTIKHCLPGGDDTLYPVAPGGRPHFIPASAKETDHHSAGQDSLVFEPVYDRAAAHREPIELTNGRVYVMNEAGATVATYWLTTDGKGSDRTQVAQAWSDGEIAGGAMAPAGDSRQQ